MSDTTKQLGVVVVGAGDMGAKHALHWHNAGAKVIAVCDPDLDRAKVAADPVGADAIADYKSLVSQNDVHAASVCTPTFLHAAIATEFTDLGKHVLIEKPIALTLEQTQAISESAKKTGAQVRVGFMRRFDEAFPKYLDFCLTNSLIYTDINSLDLASNRRPSDFIAIKKISISSSPL